MKNYSWKSCVERSALFVLKMMIVCSPMIIFFSLPLFRIGIWPKHEPVICVLYAISFCVTASLCVLFLIKPYKYLVPCLHPVVLLPMTLGLWGCIGLFFSGMSLLNILGDPRFGQGIVRYFCIASLVAGSLICLPFKNTRRLIAFTCTVTTLIIIGLHFFSSSNTIFPGWDINTYDFVDYLAFFSIFNAMILFALFPNVKFRIKGLFVFFGVFVLWYSSNRSGIILFFAVSVCVGLTLYLFNRRQYFLEIITVALVVMLPILIMGISSLLYLSVDKQNENWMSQSGKLYSIYSRVLLWDMALKGIQKNPKILVFGAGWGEYSNQLIRFAGQENLILHATSNQWDALRRGDWHSHNDFIEVLTACGIPGLLLWWSFLCIPPLYVEKKRFGFSMFFAVFLSGLFCLWFQISACVPFMAISFACFAQRKCEKSIWKNFKTIKYFACFVICVVLLLECYAFVFSLSVAWKTDKIKQHIFDMESSRLFINAGCDDNIDVSSIVEASGPGCIHFATLYNMIVLHEISQGRIKESNLISTFDRAYNIILHSESDKSLIFYLNGLSTRNELACANNVWGNSDPLPLIMQNWNELLLNFLDKAELRSDMAVPYLLWCLSKNDNDEILKISNQLLVKNNKDPVGLWFYGLAMAELSEGDQDDSITALRESINNGIERVMPIDPDIKHQLFGSKL